MTSNFDIFISYTSKSPTTNQIQIQKLCRRLTEDFGFKVWLGNRLFKKIVFPLYFISIINFRFRTA